MRNFTLTLFGSPAHQSRLALTSVPTNTLKSPFTPLMGSDPHLFYFRSRPSAFPTLIQCFGGRGFLLNRLVSFLNKRSNIAYLPHLKKKERNNKPHGGPYKAQNTDDISTSFYCPCLPFQCGMQSHQPPFLRIRSSVFNLIQGTGDKS